MEPNSVSAPCFVLKINELMSECHHLYSFLPGQDHKRSFKLQTCLWSPIPKILYEFNNVFVKYREVSKSPLNPYKSLPRKYISTIWRLSLWFQGVGMALFSFFFNRFTRHICVIQKYIQFMLCLRFFAIFIKGFVILSTLLSSYYTLLTFSHSLEVVQ